MRSDIPHYIGCDLAVFPSDEEPPAFAEAVYTPGPDYRKERALYRLDLMLAEADAEAKVAIAAVALLVFFGLGLLVGSM